MGLSIAMLLASTDALVVSHSALTTVGTRSGVFMRAPYDPRSATETFAMWNAAQPPAGFVWGYDSRSTTETYEQWASSEPGEVPGMATSATPVSTKVGVPSVGANVLSWYDAGYRITSDDEPLAELTVRDVPPEVRPTSPKRIAMGKWVNGRWVAKGKPELPKAESSESSMSVEQACSFIADPLLAGTSTAAKKAFLASKGISSFVIAQSECVAPEDNVQGHPGESKAESSMSVEQACSFIADPLLAGTSTAAKKAFLASKGISSFVIAQSECVAPVQG